jgi:hypothetical protein
MLYCTVLYLLLEEFLPVKEPAELLLSFFQQLKNARRSADEQNSKT